MIEEKKTHYSNMRYCNLIGKNVIVEEMKVSGNTLVLCRYINLGSCNVDRDYPRNCPFKEVKLSKLIKKTED